MNSLVYYAYLFKLFESYTLMTPLIVSVAAVIVSIYSARNTKKNNEEILKYQREIAEKSLKATLESNDKTLAQQKQIAKENIQADVVSKARVDWIQKERDYLSQYISLASNMNSYYEVWITDKMDPDRFLKYCKRPVEFQNLKNLLVMSLGPDDETQPDSNKNFINLIDELYKITEKTIGKAAYTKNIDERDDKIEELTKFARNYFKNEWNKAKEGK